MKLDIVMRTCDHTNVHNDWRVRYCNKPKNEIVKGCVTSLVNSCNIVKDHDISLTILDDHSSEDTLNYLKNLPWIRDVDLKIINLEKSGYNNSSYEQWLMCRDSTADLTYSIEDDYIHCLTAVQEMLESYEIFKSKIPDKEIVIYPFNDPHLYNPPDAPGFIVTGSHRHWRTALQTTQVLMCTPELYKKYWSIFETLALKYNGDYLKPRTEHFDENNTIGRIWRSGQALRFSPIPSLALHLQYKEHIEPFIDWAMWWNEFAH